LYFEVVALFWWGVLYGRWLKGRLAPADLAIGAVALLWFAFDGPRGWARTALLALAAGVVHLCRLWPQGARLTHRVGDLSYGVYIYAFPVQQLVVHVGKAYQLAFWQMLTLSAIGTLSLAWVSWHGVEAWALQYKPAARGAT
jgi:peptidoglycan/LPS O-acetylase OafA/YrhL